MTNRAFFSMFKMVALSYAMMWLIFQGFGAISQGNVKHSFSRAKTEIDNVLFGVEMMKKLGAGTPSEALAKINKKYKDYRSKPR